MQLGSPIIPVADQHLIVPTERFISVDGDRLEATLTVPPAARGVVALLHASSAGRFGLLSRFTAQVLDQAGLATLQVDLLLPDEEAALVEQGRSSTALLTRRVAAVVDWLNEQPATRAMRVGLFASERELAAALRATELRPRVAAVMSRGGLPTTADASSSNAPTLFLVEADQQERAAELALEFFGRHLAGRS